MALVDSPGLIITHASVSYCLQREIFGSVANNKKIRYSETILPEMSYIFSFLLLL